MKRFLFIFIILLGVNFISFAQSKPVDTEAKLVSFYPSPATTIISFDFPHNIDRSYSLQLYNFMGKMVGEYKITTQHMDVPLGDFYRGIYIYQLRNISGEILECGKFQVIK
ncbi:MAG: T9SS type A sorting domain-containing protein [Ferruginibacter sp.]